ncbi:MAG: DUF4363 family protein [Dysosmobacter sp.]|nr:DUF4363 family protein [Dysosmobacter sp.]
MKKGLLIPAALLAAILSFCLWNSAAMASHTARWREQLERADRLAQAGDWDGASAAIREGYAAWSARQAYLHIVTNHGAVDSAEAMYRRALAFAESREDSELRAELAELREQLRLLAEMEEFSVRNVL